MATRCHVFGPTKKDIAGRLHRPLAFDHTPAGMAAELRTEPLEHGLASFLELQEQWSAIVTEEQSYGTECSHASDPDCLECHVCEFVLLEKTEPLRWQALLVVSEDALGIDAMHNVAVAREMIDQR